MIVMFDKNETKFESNGLAVIDNDIRGEPVVNELFNGLYSLEFKYSKSGEHLELIDNDMIVKAPTPDGDQPFRIYKVIKQMGYYDVSAYHIFYDLAGNFIEDSNIVDSNGMNAIKHIGTGLQYPTSFEFTSDIAANNSARIVRMNAVQALLDTETDNSFINRWGGEIKRDGDTISMNKARGTDRGFKVKYRKNLTGFEATFDRTNVVTRIMPYGYNGLMLPEKYVDSPHINDYPIIYIKKFDYNDIKAIDPDADNNDENAVPLEEAYELLRQAAQREYDDNKVDIPTSNFKITMKELSDTRQYSSFKAIEKLEPWDYVSIDTDVFSIKSRMISYKYNPKTKHYIEVELGNYIPSFSDVTSKTDSQINEIQNNIDQLNNDVLGIATAPNGNHTIWADRAPTADDKGKDGDVWYYQNGDLVEMWVYDGTATPPQWRQKITDLTGQEIEDKVDQAQEDATKALNDANTAVENSNKAVEDAGFANNTANDAKASADDATNKAAEALNDANNALTNASQAQKDANTATGKAEDAISAANKAQGDATNAINNAQDALDKYNNLKSGNRNYLLNTAKPFEADWNNTTSGNQLFFLWNYSGGGLKDNGFNPGELALLEYDWEISNVTTYSEFAVYFESTPLTIVSSTGTKGNATTTVAPSESVTSGHVTVLVKWKDAVETNTQTKIKAYCVPGFAAHIKISNAILAKRNVPGDWSPAPEDVETEITNINGELSQKVSQTEYNNLKGTVESNSTQITQNQHDIQLKANQTQVDTINKTVQNQQTEINQNASQIELKADQSQVDTINKTVQQNTANIGVNANAIKLKADSSTVDNLAGRVTKTEGELTVQADKIAQTVSKTELDNTLGKYATQTWTQGQIKTTADNINLSVQKVQSDLDNLEIGGQNYIRNGNFADLSGKYWRDWNGATGATRSINKAGDDWPANTPGLIKLVNPNGGQWGYAQDNIRIDANATYVVSALFQGDAGTKVALQHGNGDTDKWESKDFVLPGGKVRLSYTFTTGAATTTSIYVGFSSNGKGTAWVSQIKLERGNKATDWTPSPEDTASATDFANLEIKVNGIQGTVANKADQSQVTQLADQITSVVSTVNGNYSQITQLSNEINLRVTADQVDASILADKTIKDTRDDNQPPSWYYANYPKQTIEELKRTSTIGLADGSYAQLTSEIAWTDKSVPIKQTARTNTQTSQRFSTSETTWSSWSTIADTSNVISQINISTEGILIAGQKVHITGQTTIDNAVIKDAMISTLSASKLTAGTIDAGKINVVNLNASNITTGTITGSNLSINLNTGEILFTKGSIKSTNGLLNINVNNGSFSQTNASGDGIYFMSGELNLIDKNFTWPDLNSDHTYGTIDNFGVNMFDQQSVRSMRILGTKGVHLETGKTGGSLFLGMLGSSGTGADFDTNHSAIYSSGRSYISAGNSRGKLPAQAMIQVGVPLTYPGSKLDWAINPNSDGYDSGKDIILESDTILLQADKEHVSSFAVASDKRSGYLMSTTAYNRSYSSGQTATITQNGVFGVIVSAAKYKLAISDVNDLSDQAHSFLSVKPKQWFDKTETEEVVQELTDGYDDTVDSPRILPHYGYIAEDIYSAGLDNVTIQDAKTGELQGIQYDRLTIYLHQLVKELYQRVNDLEAKVHLMEANK